MDGLHQAALDLRYLLGRGYPRPGALTFVGNRYQLPREDRDVLNRGVYPTAEAAARRARLRGPDAIRGRCVGVDGHNVLITLESALLGRRLIRCDDGLIRDATGAAASYRPSETTDSALDMIMDYLRDRSAGSVLFLLDAPMSCSGELAAQVRAVLAGRGMMGRARAAGDPDFELATFSGLVATSDSVLVDRAAEPLDLAGCIIRERMPEAILESLDGPGGSE
ncbi:MAG: DUF434 domain-containing protein [Proteobacteria bacterium]|nr:DUF434 domain-containing protein [Pseudomonadota bacterium]